MGREYHSKRSSRARKGGLSQLLVVTVTFVLGYLTASVFDMERLTAWVNTQLLAHQELALSANKPKTQEAAIAPKPKFEFYTLLANEKVANSQPVTNTAVNQQPTKLAVATAIQAVATNAVTATTGQQVAKIINKQPEVTAKGAYSVQVASFKARHDAEHMKGLLTLKGFNVHVVPINDATRGNWFRVVVGPYSNRILAQRAQFDLAKREHLSGMLTAG
jgi:cell division protein FtsN